MQEEVSLTLSLKIVEQLKILRVTFNKRLSWSYYLKNLKSNYSNRINIVTNVANKVNKLRKVFLLRTDSLKK